MPSLQGLLQRWGFVKLRRYGLELTPDGRIVSSRPVLDDGAGSRIVGWRDGDVSIWKLSSHRDEPAAAPQPVVAPQPVAMPQPAAPRVASPAPVLAEPVVPPPVVASAPVRPSAAVMQAHVAAEPTVDEDDWEWTIALARARVAVEETESAQPPPPAPRPYLTQRAAALQMAQPPERPTPPRTGPLSVRDPAASGEWPKTDLSGAIDYDDDSRVSTRPSIPIPTQSPASPAPPVAVAIPRTTTPNTVIPVPALPTTAVAALSRMEPVVRTTQVTPVPPASAARFAKGTGPVDPPPRPAATLIEDTIPNLSVGDRTTPGVAMPPVTRSEPVAPPADDRTKPGIAMPPAARTMALPSIKRRMSQR